MPVLDGLQDCGILWFEKGAAQLSVTEINRDANRRKTAALLLIVFLGLVSPPGYAWAGAPDVPDWLQTARVFLIDAYYPPMAPEMEFDAEALAATMEAMNVNTVRMATMGKYATIQGVRFTRASSRRRGSE